MKDIKGVLNELIADLNMGKLMEEAELKRDWPRVAGAHIAANSRPISLIRGCLTLGAYSSTWSNQLSMMKPGLLEEINKYFGKETVKEIRFKLIERQSESQGDSGARPIERKISESDKREILSALKTNIEDERLREGLKRAIFIDK